MCFKNLASYTLVSLLMVSAAGADIIEISNNTSGSFLLYSHSLGDLFGSDEAPDFSTDQLALAHEELMSWGIDTDGKITFWNDVRGVTAPNITDIPPPTAEEIAQRGRRII